MLKTRKNSWCLNSLFVNEYLDSSDTCARFISISSIWIALFNFRISLMNRCGPDLSQSSIVNKTRGFFEFINADDVFRKVLSDLYTSWREILILCAIALGLYQ